jgi:hypothetical protein
MLGKLLVTTTRRVLRLRMDGMPPAKEGSCEYMKQAAAETEAGAMVLQLVDGHGISNPSH